MVAQASIALLAALAVQLVVAAADGRPRPRTIFVSSTNGSDSNSGASASAAIASVHKAIGALRPGDTMLLRRGDAWTVESVLQLGGTGSLTSPRAGITIGAFGAGLSRIWWQNRLNPPTENEGARAFY